MDFVPAEEFEQLIYKKRKKLRRKNDEKKKKDKEIENLKLQLEIFCKKIK